MLKYNTVVLSNGVRLILAEDKKKNQTYAELSLKFGGLRDKYLYNGKVCRVTPGCAHLMEHYLVEYNIYGSMFDHFKDKYVDFNAFTNGLRTRFYINTVYDFYDRLEELIRIINIPKFRKVELENIKKPILEEIKRGNDRYYEKFNRTVNECLYRNIEYRNSLGTTDDVKSIKIEELKEIHDLFYQPANQTIYIAGNFDTEKVIQLIEDVYEEINRENYYYKVLDKQESVKVRRKKIHVIDSQFDEICSVVFKVDASKLTPKEKVKSTFYLDHFLDYNFNESSNIFQKLYKDNDTIYALQTSLSYLNQDICYISVKMYGKNVAKFSALVLDAFKKKYVDEEMFELFKKRTLIDMIIRNSKTFVSASAYYDNIISFDYYECDKIADVEEFSLEDYKAFLKKLNFSNYIIAGQTKE